MKAWKETMAAVAQQRSVRSYFQTQQDRKYIIRLSVTLLVITMVSATALGLVNYVTSPLIDQRIQEKTEAAMRSVLDADYYRDMMFFEPADGVMTISQSIDGGAVSGYVCQVESNGFGGKMNLVVGVDLEGRVTGVAVIKHSETKNIGTKVVESESVLADFTGLAFPVVAKSGEEGFDAVSGATYSSEGVLGAVNAALKAVAEFEAEGVK